VQFQRGVVMRDWLLPASTNAADIVARRAADNGIPVHVLKGPQQPKRWSRVRHDIYRELYDTGLYTLPQIGRLFNRHHTTILHGIRRSRERMVT